MTENPWRHLPARPPFVLPTDEPTVRGFDERVGPRRSAPATATATTRWSGPSARQKPRGKRRGCHSDEPANAAERGRGVPAPDLQALMVPLLEALADCRSASSGRSRRPWPTASSSSAAL